MTANRGIKIGLLVALLFSALVILWPVSKSLAQVQYEVACPAGYQPVNSGAGVTFNPSTGKYRANECVDGNGFILLNSSITIAPGVSGLPAVSPPVNSVQVNRASAFFGDAEFTYPATGQVVIAQNTVGGFLSIPGGTPPALAGQLRLGNGRTIAWRDGGNAHENILTSNNTNFLTYQSDSTGITAGNVARVLFDTIYLDIGPQAANVISTAATTPQQAGLYRVSCMLVITQAATTSSTLPDCRVQWNEATTTVAQNTQLTTTSATNVLGQISPTQTPTFVYTNGGTNINWSTTGYASVGATPMQYGVHLRIEGPF